MRNAPTRTELKDCAQLAGTVSELLRCHAMRTKRWSSLLILILAGGCEAPELVGAGAACNSLSDCREGLSCIEGRCSADISALAGAVPSYDEPAMDAGADAVADAGADAARHDGGARDASANPTDATTGRADATVGVSDATAGAPDASRPDATLPDATLPDATLPDATLPDAEEPDA